MLRCDATRLGLTSTDLTDLETRRTAAAARRKPIVQHHDLKGKFPATIVQQIVSVDINAPNGNPLKTHVASPQKKTSLSSSLIKDQRKALADVDTQELVERELQLASTSMPRNLNPGAAIFVPRATLTIPPRISGVLAENALPRVSQDRSMDGSAAGLDNSGTVGGIRRGYDGARDTNDQDDLGDMAADLEGLTLDPSSLPAGTVPPMDLPAESRLPIGRHGTHRPKISQSVDKFGHRLRQSLDTPSSKGSMSVSGSALGMSGSQSTPNLLRSPQRNSTLDSQDVPTIEKRSVSPQELKSRFSASTVSSISSLSDHFPVGVSAGEEYLRFRNSPLDQLAEDLSRLGFRMRSHFDSGHTVEGSPRGRGRPALLSGNPFNTDSEYSDDERHDSALEYRISSSIDEGHNAGQWHADDTNLPSSPPLPIRSSIVSPQRTMKPITTRHLRTPSSGIATSMHHTGSNKSTRNVQSPPSARAIRSLARLKRPLKTVKALMTPRVHVYDDSQPPSCQPQTPADVLHARTISKTTATTATHSSRCKETHDRHISPSGQPSRYRAHPNRHTYPISSIPVTAEQSAAHSTTATAARTPRRTIHLGIHSARRPRRRVGRHSEEENVGEDDEIVGLLDEMQSERQVWEARRAREGNLEMTPPEEGRFERLLR